MCSNGAARRARIGRLAARTALAAGVLGATACGYAVSENPPPPAQSGMSTGSQRVPGEYIVTLQGEGDGSVPREVYAPYGVVRVKELGRGQFLVKLKQDPGVSEVQRAGAASGKIKAVQPNFVYRRGMP